MGEPLEPDILKGVASTTIEKLLKAGCTILKSVAVTPVREIAERTGMGMDIAFKVSTLSMEKVDPGFQHALARVAEKRHSVTPNRMSRVMS